MNKEQIIQMLTKRGVEHDPKANKADLLALLPEAETQPEPEPETVTVIANRPITEGGASYQVGESFPCDAARAKALGSTVSIQP